MNIRNMALDTIQQIRKKQNWFTKKSRKDAIDAFDDFLKTDNRSDDDIYTYAKLALQVAKMDGYGRSGEQGSSFVHIMSEFIKKTELKIQRDKEQAELLAAARVRDEKIRNENNLQNTLGMIQKLSTYVGNNAYQKQNEERLTLEDNLSNAFAKHYPTTHIRASWNRYISDVRNGREIPSTSHLIFKTKDLQPEVQNALQKYFEFLEKSPNYLKQFRKAIIENDNIDVALNLPQYESEVLEVRGPMLDSPNEAGKEAVDEYYQQKSFRR